MHAIHHLDFSCRESEKMILAECREIADRNGDYDGQVSGIRFVDRVLRNREEAEAWIDEHDTGWYDNLGIKYKEGRKINWLVKIEYHC